MTRLKGRRSGRSSSAFYGKGTKSKVKAIFIRPSQESSFPRQVDSWQGMHDIGVFSPVYKEDNQDVHHARRLLANGVSAPTRILDIGAGRGRITAGLDNPLIQVVSLEPTTLRADRHKARQANVRAIAEEMPFKAGSFDKVIVSYALEYADRNRAVAEIKRVLKPGGKAVLLLHKKGSIYQRSIEMNVRSNAGVIEILTKLKSGRYRKFAEILRDATKTGVSENPEFPKIREFLREYFEGLRGNNRAMLPNIEDAIRKMRILAKPFQEMVLKGKQLFANESEIRGYFGNSGLNVEEVKVIERPGEWHFGYAVLLEKPA